MSCECKFKLNDFLKTKLNSSKYIEKDNRKKYLQYSVIHTNHYLSTVFVNIVYTA